MHHLRTINALGVLFVDGEEQGPADYELEIFEEDGRTYAHGILTADAGIDAAFASSRAATLTLPDGQEVELIVTDWIAGDNRARIKVNGPVPRVP